MAALLVEHLHEKWKAVAGSSGSRLGLRLRAYTCDDALLIRVPNVTAALLHALGGLRLVLHGLHRHRLVDPLSGSSSDLLLIHWLLLFALLALCTAARPRSPPPELRGRRGRGASSNVEDHRGTGKRIHARRGGLQRWDRGAQIRQVAAAGWSGHHAQLRSTRRPPLPRVPPARGRAWATTQRPAVRAARATLLLLLPTQVCLGEPGTQTGLQGLLRGWLAFSPLAEGVLQQGLRRGPLLGVEVKASRQEGEEALLGERLRHLRVAEPRGRLRDDDEHGSRRRYMKVRRLQFRHLHAGDAQGPDVGPRIVAKARLDNFGRHPIRGADHGVSLGEGVLQLARDTEVCQLGGELLGQQNVPRLDITMYLLVIVKVLKAQQHLSDDDPDLGLPQADAHPPQDVADGAVLAQLHDDHHPGFQVLAKVDPDTEDFHNLRQALASLQDGNFLLHDLVGRGVLKLHGVILIHVYLHDLDGIQI
mmetsp:Transcript_30491/g.78073  ORF Transcript_30491/g.78073 Transcript_30491/m.78073 type:complete len:476 (-) Transcript_30491:178-1605(-)